MDQDKIFSINIGGSIYQICSKTMLKVKSSKLAKIAMDDLENKEDNQNVLFFERPRLAFEAILAYHQTGFLHIPGDICPGALKTEIDFWGIDPHAMEKCCYHKYMTHIRDQETLSGFLKKYNTYKDERETLKIDSKDVLVRARNKIWTILDNKDKHIVTKVHFKIIFISFEQLIYNIKHLNNV